MTERDFESLSLTELIRLQDALAQALRRRFERRLALAASDVVGSTAYFARFGDAAGRALQQRHLDALSAALAPHGGRLVDTAGDGAFACFPRTEAALDACVDLEESLARDNRDQPREHKLQVRVAVHAGPVLTDGALVTGDAVNLVHRVVATADAGEIRLTRDAALDLPAALRPRCRALGPLRLKGIPDPVEVLSFEWRDPARFPTAVRIEETGEQIALPTRDPIRFGRLRATAEGAPANEIVLSLPDPDDTRRISRFQFELHHRESGFALRNLSDQATEVDGHPVPRNEETPILPTSIVRVSGLLTLHFLAPTSPQTADETIAPR